MGAAGITPLIGDLAVKIRDGATGALKSSLQPIILQCCVLRIDLALDQVVLGDIQFDGFWTGTASLPEENGRTFLRGPGVTGAEVLYFPQGPLGPVATYSAPLDPAAWRLVPEAPMIPLLASGLALFAAFRFSRRRESSALARPVRGAPTGRPTIPPADPYGDPEEGMVRC